MDTAAIHRNLIWIVAATLAVLTIGTVWRLVALRGSTSESARQRIDSLKTWWALAIVLFVAVLSGRLACTVLFTILSLLAFREFADLHLQEFSDRPLRGLAYIAILLGYLAMELGGVSADRVMLALIAFIMLAGLLLIVQGETAGFVRRIGGWGFGLVLLGVGLGHAVRLLHLPPESNPRVGVMGWLLFLVLSTQLNDIAQALIGRRIGHRRITPRVSPQKTWEGFLGGLVFSVVIAIPLGRWLTSFDALQAALAGTVIAVSGFLGDLTFSAVKRDAGVKDSSQRLPGQGGLLDRIDSLTFSAPAFYYFVAFSENLRGYSPA